MTSNITNEDLLIINQEERCLQEALDKIKDQIRNTSSKLVRERDKARELTIEMVNAQQVEDKQLIASDEAVAHAMSNKMAEDEDVLYKLKESPYFARFVLEEEFQGKTITREYKLGKFANPDCRIIDWRKAPMAKVYYEYREGDSFFEEIQGQEREGTVLLRHAVDIKKSTLLSLTTSNGAYKKVADQWIANKSPNKNNGGQQGKLPEVLSLISAEQFQMITQDAETAILLQGVAGSGKTTVALHRLSWLVGNLNAKCQKENCVIIAESPALRTYIGNSLQELDLTGIKICNYEEWAAPALSNLGQDFYLDNKTLHKTLQNCSQSVKRFLASLALLEYVENSSNKIVNIKNPLAALAQILTATREILELDQSKLLSRELIDETKSFVESCLNKHEIHTVLLPLLLKIEQLKAPSSIKKFDHILVDEVQDATSAKLATLLSAVQNPASLTLVGDTAQSFNKSNNFPGWEALKKRWASKATDTNHISLEISHRSTLQIMKLADYVQNRQIVDKGRNGRTPILFKQKTEESAIKACINWLNQAQDRYPNEITAVICATRQHAKILESLLRPTFGGQLRLEVGGTFSFESGVIITSIKDVRGLEFTNVLLWDVSKNNYPNQAVAQNALYIAITRAAENLCLICWNQASELLPKENSKLIRLFAEESDEDFSQQSRR